jgi:hypothetical protein
MQLTQPSMEPLANDLTGTHNDGSNQRIRTHPPAPALRKLESPPQVGAISSCKGGIHH